MIKSEAEEESIVIRVWTKDRERCRSSLVMESVVRALAGIMMSHTGLVDEMLIEFVAKAQKEER